MGDGGVACMPLQHNIMDTFPIQEKTTLCGGKNGNNGFNSKTVKKKKIVKVMKPKKKVVKNPGSSTNVESEKSELGLDRGANSATKEAENGENAEEKKEEVEEGELGTLKWPKVEEENGEFVPEKSRRSEIEKGEIVGEKWRRGEVEKAESFSGKWRRGDVEKGEIVPERSRKVEAEFGSWRPPKDEIEKGEFIPDRWQKGEVARDDYTPSKFRRYDMGKEKSWKFDRERTPPPGKYSNDDPFRRKDFSRSGSQQSKSNARWDSGPDRKTRISSKIVDEDGAYRNEYSNAKCHPGEYPSVNRLKRFGTDTSIGERKNYGDYGDYPGTKFRRVSDDTNRSAHSEHYSRSSVERSYRNSSSSRVASDKYSSRPYESTLSSRVVYDRHGRSPGPPGHSERSPRDRARYFDHRDRSPMRRERSPYVHERSPYGREKSPYGREKSPHGREKSSHGREKSPHGRERSPYGRERSPYSHERSPYVRERSPYVRERSPFVRERSPYGRERSPYGQERSPYDRSRQYGHRNRSLSPQDRPRYHDRRNHTPNYLERSPHDRIRPNNHRDTSRKGGASERRNSHYSNRGQEDKLMQKDPCGRDSHSTVKESLDRSTVPDSNVSVETNTTTESHKEEPSQIPSVNCTENSHISVAPPEELLSMEEDMDICDTPPHVPVIADSSTGKWFYLDYYGVERGPSKLCELKSLVEEGALMSDHMVKHSDSDRWVTVENAVSPLVTVHFPSIVSDSITRLVSPPEAPGNLLADTGDTGQYDAQSGKEAAITLLPPGFGPDVGGAASEPLQDLRIEERVGALMEGLTVIPGRELEAIGEVLQMSFEYAQRDGWENTAGFSQGHNAEQYDQKTEEPGYSDIKIKEAAEIRLTAPSDKDAGFACGDSDDWFSDRWSCKGGDWKRNDEASQERSSRKKFVVNDGFPLCQMPKSGYEDPRWHKKDELYYPSQSRRLDLPTWAFSCPDEISDFSGMSRTTQIKPTVIKGIIGTMLPVVRINACVVKDHGSFVSEPRIKARGMERYTSRSSRSYTSGSDGKRSSGEGDTQLKPVCERQSQGSSKCITSVNTKKDRICTVDELQLHLGDWYYLDGAGHERGPSSFSELQVLVDQGVILKHTNVDARIAKRARLLVDESEDDYDLGDDLLTVEKDESTFEDLCGDASLYTEESRSYGSETGSWGLLDGQVLARIFHFLRLDMNSLTFASMTCKHWRAAVGFYKDISRQVDFSSLGPNCTDSAIVNIMSGYGKEKINSMVLNGCTNITPHTLEEILSSLPCLSTIDIRGCNQFGELVIKFQNLNWIKSRSSSGTKIFEESHSKIRSLKQISEKSSSVSRSKVLGNDMDDFSELKVYFDSVDKRETANLSFRGSLYKRSKLFDARRVTAVDGRYQIGIYTVRKIQYGEEVTFDYNSVTESKEEYEASVCLCGSQVCRGSYLNLTGEGAFQKVLKEWHGTLDRHQLMLEACELNSVSEEDYLELGRAGLGSCLLGGLPDWVIAYSARLVRFINFERTKLPEEILKHNLEEKRKYFSDICLEVEKSDAEVQAEGVYNQRLQNLAVTLDKVRYVMRCAFGNPKDAPPPLERLSPLEAVSFLWKGEGSLVQELLQSMAPHVEEHLLNDLRTKILARDPSGSDDIWKELKRSLLWLRDEVRNLPCTYKSRNDAAADLIHIYAYTRCFVRIREYKTVTSPPVYISPLDLGPKYTEKLGSGFQEYCKTYGENYCLGQLIFWYNQTSAEPDCSLARASRGCLSLPNFSSFYAKVQKPSLQRVYGPRTVKFMLARMEKQPQRPWPKDRIWSFDNSPKVIGSPMLDAVVHKSHLDREMVHWLKHRPAIFQAMWDR
ncbi:hypothetical protein C1H46_024244 [Malus baccata]|uniref:SET domain-containing protein n=1 Tax=Malus baccata TaxID=106549 RepID=A0A540LUX7_MALBA|nr:hypothetical protein C1H46_024244 [Malus baccata]